MVARGGDRDCVSELTTGRLSVYVRCLTYLESSGQKTVSSHDLAERFHLNSALIRKDLACVGDFGTRGVGYDVARLKAALVRELGIDRTRNIVIAGAGNLGMALADYHGFNSEGFRIVALLDNDATKAGQMSRSGVTVIPWEKREQVIRENAVEIGIIAVTPEGAQHVHDALVSAGVGAILNFAPVQLRVASSVKVRTVDLRINLESLSFHLKNAETPGMGNDY